MTDEKTKPDNTAAAPREPKPGGPLPDAIARDEAQTERQAPESANPGEAAADG